MNLGAYENMLMALKKEVCEFMEDFDDDSRFVSGWGHAYFCNEDGGRLLYDRKQPFAHTCTICGRVYREYLYNSCYVTMLRNEAVVTALKAAILYRAGNEKKYLEWVIQILDFYKEHYQEFAVHAKEKINVSPTEDVGGAGKIMPQGLNEAIIAIRMVNALELVKGNVSPEWLDSIKTELFTPMAELLLPQKMHIHNIPVWINSAIGVMGLFFQERAWIQEATEHPFHLFEQLEKGVTDSGFWYEGSIHYNFFALEGIMSFFVFAEAYQFTIEEKYKNMVFHMLEAAYEYAFDNDIFPNPSDGWPGVGLKTYSYVYYMGCRVFGERAAAYGKHIEKNPLERVCLPLSEPYYFDNRVPLEKLLYAPDLDSIPEKQLNKRSSKSFESSNCAILRNETFNVFLKYGHQTQSHAHPDKMNVEIMAGGKVLTRDLSNSGYASKMCKEWHRQAAAHNICAVNGMAGDMEHPGELLSFSEHHIRAAAKVYENGTFIRDITLEGNVLSDSLSVSLEENSTIDWFFHFETPVKTAEGQKIPNQQFSIYGPVLETRELKSCEGQVTLHHELGCMKLNLEPGMRLYLAKTYNNPADKMRDTLIIRKQGTRAEFKMEFKYQE